MEATQRFDYEATVSEGMARIVATMLASADPAAQLSTLVDQAAALADEVLAGIQRTNPPRALACRPGCSYCCHTAYLPVTPLEVFRIVRYMVDELPEETLAGIVRRTSATIAAKDAAADQDADAAPAGGDSPPARLHACPLLSPEDGTCLVHPARPFVCRGCNAYDVTPCELRWRHGAETVIITGDVHRHRVAHAVFNGIRLGLMHTGRERRVLDLARALAAVMADPDSLPRWLAGEPVFAGAEVPDRRDTADDAD